MLHSILKEVESYLLEIEKSWVFNSNMYAYVIYSMNQQAYVYYKIENFSSISTCLLEYYIMHTIKEKIISHIIKIHNILKIIQYKI